MEISISDKSMIQSSFLKVVLIYDAIIQGYLFKELQQISFVHISLSWGEGGC